MKKQAKNLDRNASVKRRFSLKPLFNLLKESMIRYDIAAALKSNSKRIFMPALLLLLLSALVFADGWPASPPYPPSHQTLYANTITSKTDGSAVSIADSHGLYVTGNVGLGAASPKAKLDLGNSGGSVFVLNPGSAASPAYTGFAHNDLIMGSYISGGYSQAFISIGYTSDVNRKFHIG